MRRCEAINWLLFFILCFCPFSGFADDGTPGSLYPNRYVEEKYWSFIRTSEKIFTQYPNAEAGYSEKDDKEMRRVLENIPLYRQKIGECQRIDRAMSKLVPIEILDREYFKLGNTRENLARRLPEFKARSEAVSSKEKETLSHTVRACSAPSPSAAKQDADRARQAAREAVDAYRVLWNMFDWEKLKLQRDQVAKIDSDLRKLEELEKEARNVYDEAKDVYQKGLQGGGTNTYLTEKRWRLMNLINTFNGQYQELMGSLKPYLDQPWGLQMMNRAQHNYHIAQKIKKDFPEDKEVQYLYGKINVLASPENNGCVKLLGKKLISAREIDSYYAYINEVQSIGRKSYAIVKSTQDHAKRALECAGRMPETKPPQPPRAPAASPPPTPSPPPAGAAGCRPGEHKCGTWCCQRDVSCFDAYSMKMAVSQGRCRTP